VKRRLDQMPNPRRTDLPTDWFDEYIEALECSSGKPARPRDNDEDDDAEDDDDDDN
jgi:hypothetical protein